MENKNFNSVKVTFEASSLESVNLLMQEYLNIKRILKKEYSIFYDIPTRYDISSEKSSLWKATLDYNL
jgi:hypothetical protein